MKTKITLLITALLFVYQVNAQNVINVDNSVGVVENPPYLYSSLQSAISGASAGDIIYINASETNYGIINVDKELTLIGYSHLSSEKQTLINDVILLDNASNSKFSGLRITDDFYTNNSTTITDIVIENCYIEDDMSFSGGGIDNLIIRGNIINQIGSTSGSTNNNNYTNTIISNNIILSYIGLKNHQSITIKNNLFLSPYFAYTIYNSGDETGSITAQNNIFYYDTPSSYDPNSDGVIFENCLTYNIGSGSLTALIGSNNINDQNPLFESAPDAIFDANTDNYHLATGSPAIGTGADGVDMGLYDGSSFLFNNYGYTNGIPTVKITNITDRVAPGANLEVTINTNAN